MKEMLKEVRERKGGFTLAELLIVVAIVAVLVAIAIPVFNGQLEKAKESTDAANIRAAYAEAVVDALENDGASGTATSKPMTATRSTWSHVSETIGGVALPATTDGKGIVVTVSSNGTPTFTIES